ncbi:COG3650 family protein [Pseudomonas sp. Irchel s3h17]|uniref:COG3650 family protein n=1 Tax=Pseudomonas sp. Irchel s3h17 TaxID=2009182 RepID=UPI000BA37383|nr:hypothetical protein [Pseudomonas sp. Irchel s3h17]
MRAARSLMFVALLPLFGGCQLLQSSPQAPSTAGLTRMQGELSMANGKLVFSPCQENRQYLVNDAGATSILQEAATLAGTQHKVFADLRGRVPSATVSGNQAQLDVQQLYRLQRLGASCDNPDFQRLILRASGNTPGWSVNVTGKGMVIERAGQPALALPYLEEQVGDGRFNLSSEANNQHVELWIAPQRCVDPTLPSVQSMSAELRVNGQVQRGCAYFGGARSD